MSLRRPATALLALLALVSACASDRDDDPAIAAGGSTESTTAAADGPEMFGTLESPCGAGDAAGATDQGVTDDAIKIGFGDDAGFTGSPGLNHEVSDALRALIAWCNDQGGINGRAIEGTYYDAKVTEVNAAITKACEAEFYLVGQFFVLDDGQEPIRRECGLPTVPAAAGTATFANAPLKHEGVPSAIDRSSLYGAIRLAELFPDAIDRVGILYGNFGVMQDRRDNMREGLESLGYEIVDDCVLSYNIQGEPDWKPFVQRLKDCGAEFVYYVGSPLPSLGNVLEASHQLDFDPVWMADTNTYTDTFAEWNGAGLADRVYFRMGFLPLEEADEDPATATYIELVEADGGDIAQFGQQATSSFLLWATAAKACGSDLTRECVEAELDSIHEWDAGGMHGVADPGANEPTDCGLLMKLDGRSFTRVAPEEPGTFECDESYVYDLTGDLLTRTKIGSDRIAQL